MHLPRRKFLGAAAAALAVPALIRTQDGRAQGSVPIRIGEISSYTSAPAFTLPYRNGWTLAAEQVNAAGGVLGRRLDVISRDDGGQPQTAIRVAGELVSNEKVDLLAGGYLSNVGLALSAFAAENNKLYVAGEPLSDALVWEKGTKTCFRLRPDTYMQVAMLLEDAAKLPAKRWATVAPNYEYGQSAVKWFKKLMAEKRPDVQFVGEQWPALGHMDAGPTVEALLELKPDGIFNVTFGPDLTNFVRQGNTRGLFDGRSVVSVLTGEPEYLDALGDEAPEGWIVTGYPRDQLTDPANTAFRDAYRARFKEEPRMGSVVGYALIKSIAAGLARSGGTGTDQLIAGFSGVSFETPFGQAKYRAIDHQSTLGAYIGKLGTFKGRPAMVDWHYVDGASVMPSDAEVRKLRPAAAG